MARLEECGLCGRADRWGIPRFVLSKVTIRPHSFKVVCGASVRREVMTGVNNKHTHNDERTSEIEATLGFRHFRDTPRPGLSWRFGFPPSPPPPRPMTARRCACFTAVAMLWHSLNSSRYTLNIRSKRRDTKGSPLLSVVGHARFYLGAHALTLKFETRGGMRNQIMKRL